jgi:hypothetical protein
MERMPSLYRARLFGLAWLALSLSGCLFPVIDFEDHSTPHNLSLRARPTEGYANLGPRPSSRRASTGLTALPPRQHGQSGQEAGEAKPAARARATSTRLRELAGGSVIAPDVPAPELPTPADAASCHQLLRDEGIHFKVVDTAIAPGVRWPIRLSGAVGGVTFEPNERDAEATYGVLDCQLALALHAWAGDLRRAGVRRVLYYSMYRPFAHIAGGPRVSGHAHGMAIDAARFVLRDGVALDVLEDWEGRAHGQAPCPPRTDESSGGRLLRAITCSAADRKLFQVVLTPHYNHAHDNHVHLEIKPEVDWTYVR